MDVSFVVIKKKIEKQGLKKLKRYASFVTKNFIYFLIENMKHVFVQKVVPVKEQVNLGAKIASGKGVK